MDRSREHVVVLGLNHRTAPVEVRERLALAARDADLRRGGVRETAVLSTCNRLELYAVASDAAAVERLLSDGAPHLERADGKAAVAHLMRVAAGLDSLVLGEPQILGQVADTGRAAKEAGAAGPILARLFEQATHAGKRARTETPISRHAMCVGRVAVRLAAHAAGGLAGRDALVLGAGEMGVRLAEALADERAASITCLSRTRARSDALVATLSRRGYTAARAIEWHALAEALGGADVVFSATSALEPVVTVELVRHVPLLIVDIAVPRDVDERVRALPGVTCYDVDDLRAVVDGNAARRRAAVRAVEAIVEEETNDFLAWLESREAAPVIADLHRRAEALVEAEVALALRRLRGLDTHGQRVVGDLGRRIAKKLLHEPTARLRASSGHVEAARELFALDGGAS